MKTGVCVGANVPGCQHHPGSCSPFCSLAGSPSSPRGYLRPPDCCSQQSSPPTPQNSGPHVGAPSTSPPASSPVTPMLPSCRQPWASRTSFPLFLTRSTSGLFPGTPRPRLRSLSAGSPSLLPSPRPPPSSSPPFSSLPPAEARSHCLPHLPAYSVRNRVTIRVAPPRRRSARREAHSAHSAHPPPKSCRGLAAASVPLLPTTPAR